MSKDAGMSGSYLNELVTKMRNADVDFRYMALNDLLDELQKSNATYDDQIGPRLIDAVLKTLEDKNGEVQNLGVKCLGPLVRRSKEAHVQIVIDRLCRAGSNDELKDISSTALRTVILQVSPTSTIASSFTNRLVPKLLLQMESSGNSDVLLECIDVLVELLNRFGRAVSYLAAKDQSSLLALLTTLLDNQRSAVRKRAVIALGSLVVHIPIETFSSFMSGLIQRLTVAKSDENLKVLLQLMGQICKSEIEHTGQGRFSDYLQTLAPFVFDSMEMEDDEMKEISLQSLEAFETQGGAQIKRYDAQVLQIVTKFLQYDPNYNDDTEGDGDEIMEDDEDSSELGSDFDDDGEYDDDEDISWKVRRCAAKLAAALLKSQSEAFNHICSSLAPALVARFTEREENVRVEILQTFTVLLTQIAQSSVLQRNPSRKRLRDDADEEMEVEQPLSSRRVVAQLTPKIAKVLAKQINGKSLPTKQASFDVLTALSRQSDCGIEQHLSILVPATRTALASTSTGNNASTTSNLKISALTFLTALLSNPSPALDAQMDALVPLIVQPLLQDKLNKITVVAVDAAEHLLKTAASSRDVASYVTVCEALYEKCQASDLEQEVRDQLIRCMGECLSVAPKGAMIQAAACSILEDRIKVEATRLVSINAIGQAATSSAELDPAWCVTIMNEILGYTSNVNKVLRSAAVSTSACLVGRTNGLLEDADVRRMTSSIVALLTSDDLQLSSSVIRWLDALVRSLSEAHQKLVCTTTLPVLSKRISDTSLQSPVLPVGFLAEYFRICSARLGSSAVLSSLLAACPANANITLLSKCIAIAILQDESSDQLQQYMKEVEAPKTTEENRTLALYVIGECGHSKILGRETLELVLAQFSSPAEKVKGAAAFAFGSIVSGDLSAYLPLLFDRLDKTQEDRYLLAVSLKEIICSSERGEQSRVLSKQAEDIWHRLFSLASDDRAQNTVAECVGRLTLIKPHQLLPELQKEIKSSSTASRGVVIRAVRYTFTAANASFDEQLRPFIVDFLSLMEDKDLEIRRLALSTLYSAAHNKPPLIQDHLTNLLPLLYQETVVRKDLVHTVQMGPFKHIVDDGLELRKSAFETLHTLLESFFASMDLSMVYEIVIRGLDDVNEIRTLCLLMIVYIAQRAPQETTEKLDALTELLQKIMGAKLKESAVKQDKERDYELKRSTLRCVAALMPLAQETTPGFNLFLEEMKSTRAKELSELTILREG